MKRLSILVAVIPAKAGIHFACRHAKATWIPAFAGMTSLGNDVTQDDDGLPIFTGMTTLSGNDDTQDDDGFPLSWE